MGIINKISELVSRYTGLVLLVCLALSALALTAIIDPATGNMRLNIDPCEATLSSCSEANYNGCISEMPYATCPGAENRILACGKGNEGGCSGLIDFTATKVSLAKKGNVSTSISRPSDREKDGVCYTLPGDCDFIIEAREQSTDYWNKYDVSPP